MEKQPKKSEREKRWMAGAAAVMLFLLLRQIKNNAGENRPEMISYQQMISHMDENEIEKVHMGDEEHVTVFLKNGAKKKAPHPRSENFKLELLEKGIEVREKKTENQNVWYILLLFPAALWLLRRKKQGFSKKLKIMTEKDAGSVNFSQVAANEEALNCMKELADFLKNPEKYERYGARLPKGVLLYGPPGTGKTLLARALAGEADVPFFSANGADFVQMYVGVGASRVRELFSKARKAGGGVIFIDEIDAIGKKRDNSHEEREQTLNALLTEMSGFGPSDKIVVLGATNRPQIMDEALLRAGRFDRRIEISLPEKEERLKILSLHGKNKPLSQEVCLKKWAEKTTFFSGAQLENLLNEAALLAARQEEEYISEKDMEKAYLVNLVGDEKISRGKSFEDEKVVTAYHEAGHALVTHLLLPGQKIERLSILPSVKGAAGYTLFIPEETMFETRQKLRFILMSSLAGRAAEEKAFGKDQVTTGAAGDFSRANTLALRMAGEWKMGETGHKEKDAQLLLTGAYEAALKLLHRYEDKLDAVAGALLIHENLDGETFRKIVENA